MGYFYGENGGETSTSISKLRRSQIINSNGEISNKVLELGIKVKTHRF